MKYFIVYTGQLFSQAELELKVQLPQQGYIGSCIEGFEKKISLKYT